MNWFPLVNHSHFSILRSTSQIPHIVDICQKRGLRGIALTDYQTLAGAVEFVKAMKKAKLKWVLGLKTKIEDKWVTLLAKNLAGYQNLVKLINFPT